MTSRTASISIAVLVSMTLGLTVAPTLSALLVAISSTLKI
jgi:hypothetical protein